MELNGKIKVFGNEIDLSKSVWNWWIYWIYVNAWALFTLVELYSPFFISYLNVLRNKIF